MLLSTQLTPADTYHITTVELGYPAGTSAFFTPTEINEWLNEFYEILQTELELVRAQGTATLTSGTWTAPAMVQLGEVTYSSAASPEPIRLARKERAELIAEQPAWRATEQGTPWAIYPLGHNTWGLWPQPSGTSTLTYSYLPQITQSGTTALPFPPWLRNAPRHYVAWRFYSKFGPLQDLGRAAVYQALHQRSLALARRFKQQQWPGAAPRLRPAGPALASDLQRSHG